VPPGFGRKAPGAGTGSSRTARREGRRRAERRKGGACRDPLSPCERRRQTARRLSARPPRRLWASGPCFRAQARATRSPIRRAFPAFACAASSHRVAEPRSRPGRRPEASRTPCLRGTRAGRRIRRRGVDPIPASISAPAWVCPLRPAYALSHFKTPLEAPLVNRTAPMISEVRRPGIRNRMIFSSRARPMIDGREQYPRCRAPGCHARPPLLALDQAFRSANCYHGAFDGGELTCVLIK